MDKYKVEFVVIDITNSKELKNMQRKINAWITIGKLRKYEVHTAGNSVFFNLCLYKEF